jgi:hypothetical protein
MRVAVRSFTSWDSWLLGRSFDGLEFELAAAGLNFESEMRMSVFKEGLGAFIEDVVEGLVELN